jgi:hypothetical protein
VAGTGASLRLASRQSVRTITCGLPVFLDQELVRFDRIAVKANNQQFQNQGLPLASIDSVDPYFVRHAACAQSYDAPEWPGPYSRAREVWMRGA